MPYTVKKTNQCPTDKPYGIFKKSDGTKVGGCHATPESAGRQIAAIEANEGGKMLNKSFSAEIKSLAPEGKPEGTFSAVVAVYGNVDKVGDRISDAAFDTTLEKWRKSGDPIPIVLAHEWNNPFAHIGYAMPDKVKSVPGVGLFVEEGVLDIEDNPTARQVHRLMERRSLKEFSFGYSIPDGGSKKAQDGAHELNEITLIELGPCLKGVNDQTQLLEVKAILDGGEAKPTLEERFDKLEALILSHFESKEVETGTEGEGKAEVKAWDGSQSNYTDEEYAKACILDRGAEFSDGAKTRYSLPIAVPGKSFSDPDPEGVAAAASRIGTVSDATGEQIKTAYSRLLGAYKSLDIEPPESVIEGAKQDEDIDTKNEDVPEIKSPEEYEFTLTTLEAETMLEAAEANSTVKDVMGKSDSIYEYTLLLDDLEASLKE